MLKIFEHGVFVYLQPLQPAQERLYATSRTPFPEVSVISCCMALSLSSCCRERLANFSFSDKKSSPYINYIIVLFYISFNMRDGNDKAGTKKHQQERF